MKRFLAQENRTLRLSGLPGVTLALAVGMLLAGMVVCESAARLSAVEKNFPERSVTGRHGDFETKLKRIAAFAAHYGGVDCIFTGSSVLYRAIDTERFTAAYRSRAGESLRCFNYGVPGMMLIDIYPFVDFLITSYHPGLIIVGVSPREASPVTFFPEHPGDQPWVRYRRGLWDIQGWLIDHLYSYQYYLYIKNVVSNDGFRDRDRALLAEVSSSISPNGDSPRQGQMPADTFVFPNPPILSLFGSYVPDPAQLRALDRLIALAHQTHTALLLVELPLHPAVYTQYLSPGAYNAFVEGVRRYAAAGGVPFLRGAGAYLGAPGIWYDLLHLNVDGSAIFSTWLGEQVGAAAARGDLADRAP